MATHGWKRIMEHQYIGVYMQVKYIYIYIYIYSQEQNRMI